MKIPGAIARVIRMLDEAGVEAWVVGGAIRDTMLGEQPTDWDLAVHADPAQLAALFPEGAVLSETLRTFRLTAGTEEMFTVDLAAFRQDGTYSDYRRPDAVQFTGSIEADLLRRDFTINAMAFHPARGLLDPHAGQQDLRRRLVRTAGDPLVRFTEDPVRILRGIRLAAQHGLDIQKATFEAMQEKAGLLPEIGIERIREEVGGILTARDGAKGLRLLALAGGLPAILGSECMEKASASERENFTVLAENLNQARPEAVYRYALIFQCFDEKRAEKAIRHLQFDKKTENRLIEARQQVDNLYFLNNKLVLKRFLRTYGPEAYDFFDRIARQQKKIYDRQDMKIEGRLAMLKEIQRDGEAIYLADLAVNGKDLLDAGITMQGEETGRMLEMLLDLVHVKPGLNTKERLLKEARALKKNPLRAALRNVNWMK